jgi:serum/glucocorticoid-regulated kinase 2
MQPENFDLGNPDKKDKVTLDNFVMLSVIGKGSYAKVVLVKKKDTSEIFALKILKKKHIERRKQEEHVITERNVLVGIKHPFIVKLSYSFQNERKLFFVLDYCPGGELFNLLQKRKQFTEDQ